MQSGILSPMKLTGDGFPLHFFRPLSPTFCNCPAPVLENIFRHLDARDLSALSAQDKATREFAGDHTLWQPLCLARWPHCTAEQYAGDWRALYSVRALLPPSFAVAVDKVHRLQQQAAQGGAGQNAVYLFEETIKAVLQVGTILTYSSRQASAAHASADYAQLVASVRWWLSIKPEVAVAFVRHTRSLVAVAHDAQQPPAGCSGWQDALQRRSGLAFLQPLLRAARTIHPTVVAALDREVDTLDAAIRAAAGFSNEALQLALSSSMPPGIPSSHWWFQAPHPEAKTPLLLRSCRAQYSAASPLFDMLVSPP